MIPTTIRIHVQQPRRGAPFVGLVTTVLGSGKLEAWWFHVYLFGEDGYTTLLRDEFWSTEAGAIAQWEEWRDEVLKTYRAEVSA